MALVTREFISVGCNRVVGALDWGNNGLIAYGGHWVVCIYDPEAAEVVGTLNGHSGQVTCVKWLPAAATPAGPAVLLSGAADATIRIWAWYGAQHSPRGQCLYVLQEPTQAVTCLSLQRLNATSFLLAATTGDEHCYVWSCNHGSNTSNSSSSSSSSAPEASSEAANQPSQFGSHAWQLQQLIPVGRHIQHCCAMAPLPEDPQYIVLATGGTDSLVRLWLRSPSSGKFELGCQLSGHENWVRGLAFAAVLEAPQQQGAAGAGNGGGAAAAAAGNGGVSLLLASASQDRYCRIWRISTDTRTSTSSSSSSSQQQHQSLTDLITRWAPRPQLVTPHHAYHCSCEALLIGHEDWVHSVTWRPTAASHTSPAAAAAAASAGAAAGGGGGWQQDVGGASGSSSSSAGGGVYPSRAHLELLSASQDRSMILWVNDAAGGLWLNEASLGDAGTSCFGYYGGCFDSSGQQVVAHGFTGALHLWKQQPAILGGTIEAHGADPNNTVEQQASTAAANPSSGAGGGGGVWVPQHALGGHYGAVVDLAWGADGACLQTVSADQTARLWTAIDGHWCEIARTQIHGHDFSCIASIPPGAPQHPATTTSISSSNSSSMSQLYVSGSEEKMLRVFEAPQAFLQTLAMARGLPAGLAPPTTAAGSSSSSTIPGTGPAGAAAAGGRALGASIAALGLSNKAVYVDAPSSSSGSGSGTAVLKAGGSGADAYMDGPDLVPASAPSAVAGPPLEEHLAQNTLWPEVRKLYGHGNDVYCLAASPNGKVVASACRAQAAPTAAIWLWEVGTWRALGQLSGHALTVTQLEFSHCGRYLLAASRDRSYSLWKVPAAAAAAATAAGGSSDGADGAAGSAGAAAAAAGAGSGVVEGGGRMLAQVKNAHSRLLWGLSWSADDRWFSTAARDQTVKVWRFSPAAEPALALTLPALSAAATAVAFAPSGAAAAVAAVAVQGAQQLLAVGLESGHVQLWAVTVAEDGAANQAAAPGAAAGQDSSSSSSASLLWSSPEDERLAAAVRRLQWMRPEAAKYLRSATGAASTAAAAAARQWRLAACGDDHSVRLFIVQA